MENTLAITQDLSGLEIHRLDTIKQMKVKTNSTFGNYGWSAEAEVSDAQRDILASFGLLQILQRGPSTSAEKAMAGYEKRPEGFKRDSIAFGTAAATMLKNALESAEIETGRDDKGKAITAALNIEVMVEEYVPSEGSVPKLNDQRKIYAGKNGDATRLAALAAKVGYDGEVGDGTSANAPVEFLRAMREFERTVLAGE